MLHSNLLALFLVGAAPAASQPANSEADRLVAAATKIDCPYFNSDVLLTSPPDKIEAEGRRVEKGCMDRIMAFKAAFEAQDGTDRTRHQAIAGYLDAVTVHGENYTERLNPAAGLPFLNSGYALMMEHAQSDGGKHFHAYIENLPLFFETHKALALTGQAENADQALSAARQVIDSALEANKDENAANRFRIRDALGSAYRLERSLGRFWAAMSSDFALEGKATDAKAARSLALEAFRQHLRLSDSNYNHSKSPSEQSRARSVGAQALMEIAAVQFAGGDRAAAAQSLRQAEERICSVDQMSESDKKLCEGVQTDRRVATGEMEGDISPKGRLAMKAQIEALRASLLETARQGDEKVRRAMDDLVKSGQ